MEEQNTETKPEEEKLSLIEDAREVVNRLKIENDRKEALILREEENAAKMLLGGKGEAGMEPVKKKEETPKEYADRIMKGE
jgi:hypothetical protein